ncbi:MAG: hypothetical protein P4L46_03465, partial [Fimbriimonas sp.]|nr:hypothetical protein [Fimbriimonas sp.]
MRELRPGAYDLLVTRALREAIASLPSHLTASIRTLESVDAVEYLARELAARARRHLSEAADNHDTTFLDRANGLLDHVEANNAAESALLTAISQRTLVSPADSLVPLSQSALITND